VPSATNLSAVERRSEQDEDFVAFFTAHYGEVASALYLLTRDPAEAEDLAQEAMTRVYERWARVRSMDSPGGYLYRTALNLHRKRARRLAVAAAVRLPGSRESVDPAHVVEERVEILRLLARLSVPQRHVVVLVEWLGLDSEEAASVLGIKAASVRTRLHRARETLRAAHGENP
jgi:RNA polymerase sigma factor (sigma-70 family)